MRNAWKSREKYSRERDNAREKKERKRVPVIFSRENPPPRIRIFRIDQKQPHSDRLRKRAKKYIISSREHLRSIVHFICSRAPCIAPERNRRSHCISDSHDRHEEARIGDFSGKCTAIITVSPICNQDDSRRNRGVRKRIYRRIERRYNVASASISDQRDTLYELWHDGITRRKRHDHASIERKKWDRIFSWCARFDNPTHGIFYDLYACRRPSSDPFFCTHRERCIDQPECANSVFCRSSEWAPEEKK